MRILVSGGLGFLGSHLCGKLMDLGHFVLCLDNGLTGNSENVRSFIGKPNFEYLEHDVKERLEVEVDGIFNLACPASPPQYQKNPIDTFLTSVLGAKNLLDLALKNSCTILQASTSEVYGDPLVSPQSEKYWGNVNPYGLRSCYDEGKRGAETLFHDYNKIFGVETRIARIFNTYGTKMAIDDGRVVSNFIVNSLRGSPLTVYGNGLQIRSLCYVSDLIDGLVSLFFSKGIHQPINLGNPQPVTMLDLASEIKELTSSISPIIFADLPSDDPFMRIPEISSAKNLLSWYPKIDRTAGLTLTVEYFKEQLINYPESGYSQ